jgi:hypothetical protein
MTPRAKLAKRITQTKPPKAAQETNERGVPYWEVFERETGHVVHTFLADTMTDAIEDAKNWLTSVSAEQPNLFSVRPKMNAGTPIKNIAPNVAQNFAEPASDNPMSAYERNSDRVDAIRSQSRRADDVPPGAGNIKKFRIEDDEGNTWGPFTGTAQDADRELATVRRDHGPNGLLRVAWWGDEELSENLAEVLNTQPGKINKAQWNSSDEATSLDFVASNGIKYTLDFMPPYMGPDEFNQYQQLPDAPDQVLDRGRFVSFEQTGNNPYQTGKQGIEGTGAAAEVFGIVYNAILKYVKKYQPTYLYFQAAEPNRQRLYAALIKKMLPAMPGWKFKQHSGEFVIYNSSLFGDTVAENFEDGKGPGRPGDSVRHGIPKHATMAQLEKASHAKGRKGQLARWQLNMRRGKKK